MDKRFNRNRDRYIPDLMIPVLFVLNLIESFQRCQPRQNWFLNRHFILRFGLVNSFNTNFRFNSRVVNSQRLL